METGSFTISVLLTTIGSIVTQCFTWIMQNEFLAIMFCASVVSVGFYVIRKAKKTAKS